MPNVFDEGLPKTPANFQPLTPLVQLERAADIFPDHPAIIYAGQSTSYDTFRDRARQLASALVNVGIGIGDTVSVMLSNTPAMLEAHYGVPMTGAVLHSINTRLDAEIVRFQLEHANSKLVIVDREFSSTMKAALDEATVSPLIIDFDDPDYPDDAPFPKGPVIGSHDYEVFINSGEKSFKWSMPSDEWNAISLNYTSGTTGDPKGVVYHHRGAALMVTANIVAGDLGRHPVYLWTLPMFHCNGWCFPWSLSVVAGTHVCLRWVRSNAMYDAIADHGVTHLCGAPIVMTTLLDADEKDKREFAQTVRFMTAAAPPPESVLARMAEAGFDVVHLYGLTETYGPAVVNEWQIDWNDLEPEEQAVLKARQGVRYPALEDLTILDPQTMQSVPADGKTIGEVMFRGNIVMKGYLKNARATEEALAGGWFHSGDLGVMHPNHYLQLKDRSKDIIISGGENISSIEVEDVLFKHPSVIGVAVVAKPDDKWGETPCAFVELKPGSEVSEAELSDWARKGLARFKVPRHFVFGPLPQTSTGKVKKFQLRDWAKAL